MGHEDRIEYDDRSRIAIMVPTPTFKYLPFEYAGTDIEEKVNGIKELRIFVKIPDGTNLHDYFQHNARGPFIEDLDAFVESIASSICILGTYDEGYLVDSNRKQKVFVGYWDAVEKYFLSI